MKWLQRGLKWLRRKGEGHHPGSCGPVVEATSPSAKARVLYCAGCGLVRAYEGNRLVNMGGINSEGDAEWFFRCAANNSTDPTAQTEYRTLANELHGAGAGR